MATTTTKTEAELKAEVEKLEAKRKKALDKEIAELNAQDAIIYGVKSFYIKGAAAILASAKDQTDFLIEGAIPRGSLVMFQGDPESLKSWLAYDLAIAGAQQRQWLDFPAPEPFSTLILNYDNPDWELGRRLKRMGLQDIDKISAHSLGDKRPPEDLPALLQLPECIEALLFLMDSLKPDLVIVDSLRQSHFGEEESSSDAMRLMSAFKSMSAAGHGSTIILLHHLRKQQQGQKRRRGESASTQEARGSTEFIASLDASVSVTREEHPEEKRGIAFWGKTRGWNPPVKIERSFRVIDKGTDTMVEQIRSDFSTLAKALSDGPKTKTELCRIMDLELRQVSRLVGRAKAAGFVKDAPRRTDDMPRKIQLVGDQKSKKG